MAGDDVLRVSSTPAAIKVDVEGHEFAVLSGLKLTLSDPACRVLCVEIHPSFLPEGITSESILSLIAGFGFSTVRQMPRSSMVNLTEGEKEILVLAAR
jgi:hypothetical protein